MAKFDNSQLSPVKPYSLAMILQLQTDIKQAMLF